MSGRSFMIETILATSSDGEGQRSGRYPATSTPPNLTEGYSSHPDVLATNCKDNFHALNGELTLSYPHNPDGEIGSTRSINPSNCTVTTRKKLSCGYCGYCRYFQHIHNVGLQFFGAKLSGEVTFLPPSYTY